jgi:hypothetical protein
MISAGEAKVEWSSEKKQWHVVITVGAEVIKRWMPGQPHEAGEDALRTLAVSTAKDEGYDLEPSRVVIAR